MSIAVAILLAIVGPVSPWNLICALQPQERAACVRRDRSRHLSCDGNLAEIDTIGGLC